MECFHWNYNDGLYRIIVHRTLAIPKAIECYYIVSLHSIILRKLMIINKYDSNLIFYFEPQACYLTQRETCDSDNILVNSLW